MTMTVTRRFELDAAHRLHEHEGRCKFLHGHRYVFDVTLQGDPDYMGRVLDFYRMKELVGGWLDENWDHATLVWVKDESLLQWLGSFDQRFYVLECPPTIERLSQVLAERLTFVLIGEGCHVSKIVGYETPNSWAEWTL